ncbi:hypothetical protein [Peterkaempfera griseoplana]|nr:hypothetical protein [Peterkaempfera griseoplana]
MIAAPREYMLWDDSRGAWPALRFPGEDDESAEGHICRGID